MKFKQYLDKLECGVFFNYTQFCNLPQLSVSLFHTNVYNLIDTADNFKNKIYSPKIYFDPNL